MRLFFNFLSLIFILSLITSCEDILGTVNGGESFNGISFLGGGIGTYNSTRNHEYRFDIEENNATIKIEAKFKMGNGRVYILNSARSPVNWSNSKTDILFEELRFDFSGTYYIVLTTELEDVNEYDLEVSGNFANLERIENTEKIFSDQTWDPGGGISNYNSFRNLQYKFTVNSNNTFVDFTAYSQGPNTRIYILNSARNVINWTNSSTTAYGLAWFFERSGDYYVVVTTDQTFNDQVDLSIISNEGTLSNIQRIPSTDFSAKCNNNMIGGGIANHTSSQNDSYQLVVKETTYIDLTVSSSQNTRIYLKNSGGNLITWTNSSISTEINSLQLIPGNYTIVITCDTNTDYCLRLWSQAGTVAALN